MEFSSLPAWAGGHCIGVDPYYLTHKAEQLGYHPQVVLAGRRINDGMGRWLAEQLVLSLAERRQAVVGTRVLVLGLSFKENCPDLRNTKVVDLIRGLERYGMDVEVVDSWVDQDESQRVLGICVQSEIPVGRSYIAIVIAVAHRQFVELSANDWRQLFTPGGVLLDLKGIVPRELGALRL